MIQKTLEKTLSISRPHANNYNRPWCRNPIIKDIKKTVNILPIWIRIFSKNLNNNGDNENKS